MLDFIVCVFVSLSYVESEVLSCIGESDPSWNSTTYLSTELIGTRFVQILGEILYVINVNRV